MVVIAAAVSVDVTQGAQISGITELVPNGAITFEEGERVLGHFAGEPENNNRDSFGDDFIRFNKKWLPDLCLEDSDNDGRTNGQELGDPDRAEGGRVGVGGGQHGSVGARRGGW